MGFPEDDSEEKKFESRLWGVAIGLFLGLFIIAKCTPDPREVCVVYCAQTEKQNIAKPNVGFFWSIDCGCAKKDSVDLPVIWP